MNDFLQYISSSINDTLISLDHFGPEFILIAGFLIIILGDLFLKKKNPSFCFYAALLTVLASGTMSFARLNDASVFMFDGMIVLNHLAVLFKLIFCIVNIMFILFIRFNRSLQQHPKGTGDLISILIAVHLGLNLMVMSANLLMIYISIEMVSVGSYLMVGYLSKDMRQTEAAIKYALFGAVCSACMLYGMSLLYGFTGTLDLYDPAFLSGLLDLPAFTREIAITLMLIGIAFKMSVVPFHFWSPDIYEGAPTPVTAFLSTAPKIAGFAVLIRIMAVLQSIRINLPDVSFFNFGAVLAILAIASMIVGNFGAIWQNNVKRMLAYSSIGHTGFMLMALILLSESGIKALIFYMVIYVIMNMAAFMIADEIEERTGRENIDQYKGSGKKMGLLLTAMVIVLVSLTGLPPTVGFTAKFLVFSAAIESYNLTDSPLLLIMIITGALTTLVSLFYYFKIPLNAFLKEDEALTLHSGATPKAYIGMFLALLLLFLILFPSLIERFL